jgi:predicted dehydrogenase
LPDVATYGDYDKMLAGERPDVVAVCTPDSLHAAQTIAAAKAGVRGVYCEKPMAVNMADARTMVDACRHAGTVLAVNHQRRVAPDLVEARRLIQEDSIGEVKTLRVSIPGDMLCNGTHAVDSVLHCFEEYPVLWVLGQVHRCKPGDIPPVQVGDYPNEKPFSGFYGGHAIETGAMVVIQMKGGPRVEIYCGDMRLQARGYMDMDFQGTRGRLWRAGDALNPNLFISDASGGPFEEGVEDWTYKPVSAVDGKGRWRPVDVSSSGRSAIATGYRLLAKSILEGVPSPLDGTNALRGFEILMAAYESARLNRRLSLPIDQDIFPLDLMIEQGRFDS